MSGQHSPGCFSSVAVRFAKPGEVPSPVALAAGAMTAVIVECQRTGASPDGVISVAVGPSRELVDLWNRVAQGHPAAPATTAAADQVVASFKAEPNRFAALAFAHLLPAGQS